jgi:AraC-like DNA-binding protein
MPALPRVSIGRDHVSENCRLADICLRVSSLDLANGGGSIVGIGDSNRDRRQSSSRQIRPLRVYSTECGHIGVSMWRYSRDMKVDPADSEQALTAITMLQGRWVIETQGMVLGSVPGTTVLVNGVAGPQFYYTADSEVLKLRFDLGRLEALCWRLLGKEGRVPLRFNALMDNMALTGRWMSLLAYVVSTLDSGAEGHVHLAPNIEELLMLHLLTCQPHNYSETLRAEPLGIRPSQCRRAIAYIEQHFDEPMTLDQIAAVAGYSIRSLSRAFTRFVGNTPMRYVQNLRLERAHAELQAPCSARETISNIAMRCGFTHQGEFNRLYRSRFAETPSQTRRRARAGWV